MHFKKRKNKLFPNKQINIEANITKSNNNVSLSTAALTSPLSSNLLQYQLSVFKKFGASYAFEHIKSTITINIYCFCLLQIDCSFGWLECIVIKHTRYYDCNNVPIRYNKATK